MVMPRSYGIGNPLVKPIMNLADADKDGKLTRDEATAAMNKLYEACDTE